MDLGIAGKRAIVAAGSAGLGFATANALVAEGVRVAICGRDAEKLAASADRLGNNTVAINADLSDPLDGARFATEAYEQLGGCDRCWRLTLTRARECRLPT